MLQGHCHRHPSSSVPLLLLLPQQPQLAGLRSWQVRAPTPQRSGAGLGWLPRLKVPSSSLLFNLSGICFLQVLLRQLLQLNNSCYKIPLRLWRGFWLLFELGLIDTSPSTAFLAVYTNYSPFFLNQPYTFSLWEQNIALRCQDSCVNMSHACLVWDVYKVKQNLLIHLEKNANSLIDSILIVFSVLIQKSFNIHNFHSKASSNLV